MIFTLERLGVRMLSRVVPEVTASAGPCSCTDGHTWCCGGSRLGNTCRSECSGTFGCIIRRYYSIWCGPF
jgi:hypothetical protein